MPRLPHNQKAARNSLPDRIPGQRFRAADRETRSRACMQSYRIEAGKLVETWLILQPLGSAWADAIAQKHWTSPPPMK